MTGHNVEPGGPNHQIRAWNRLQNNNGGSTLGFTCTATNGIVNCANTLVGDQGEESPDGEGLLAS